MSVNCRWVASDQPRVVAGRHGEECPGEDCRACLPCLEQHCVVCGKEHAKAACTGCLEAARSDLHAIGELCSALPAEAVQKGVQSEAMMLLGPAADPEAWRNTATSAMLGRLPDAYLEDARDELHPLWIMGTWEQIWRDHLDHYTEAPATLASVWAYLDTQIGYMADQIEPPFDEFARELRACRSHLENVVRDGIRVERGVPCSECGRNLTRQARPKAGCSHTRRALLMAKDGDQTVMLRRLLMAYPELVAEHTKCDQGGLVEHYECKPCHRTYSEAEYWLAVRARIEEVS